MMLLTISFFILILSNPEKVQCISTAAEPASSTIPSDPYRDPTLPQSPSSSGESNVPPVPSPGDKTSKISPSFNPKDDAKFPIPPFWTNPLLPPPPRTSSSAPSPSSQLNSLDQMASKRQNSRTPLSHNSVKSKKPALSSATKAEIEKICNSTDLPPLCVSFITPFYSEGRTDIISVLEKAINATCRQIKTVMAGMTKLARIDHTTGVSESEVEDCKQSYEDALENLQNARNAIPERDIGTINSMLSAAITDFSDCDDLIKQPPISNFDDVLTDLVSTCLVIASLVK